jgi:hypothetical protein
MMEDGLLEIVTILLQENRPDLVEVIKKMTELIDEDYDADTDTDDETDDDTVGEELELKIDIGGFHSLA